MVASRAPTVDDLEETHYPVTCLDQDGDEDLEIACGLPFGDGLDLTVDSEGVTCKWCRAWLVEAGLLIDTTTNGTPDPTKKED